MQMSIIKVKDNNNWEELLTIQGPTGPQGETAANTLSSEDPDPLNLFNRN